MKTYIITLAKTFQGKHPKAGKDTFFEHKFLLGQGCPQCVHQQDLSSENISQCNSCFYATFHPKIHTIRANYPLWEKRIAEVQAGKACLSVRQWLGKPYRSHQVEIFRLTEEDGIGLQKLVFCEGNWGKINIGCPAVYTENERSVPISVAELANNDGLSFDDWKEWFKGYNLTTPLAIIHFTSFRY